MDQKKKSCKSTAQPPPDLHVAVGARSADTRPRGGLPTHSTYCSQRSTHVIAFGSCQETFRDLLYEKVVAATLLGVYYWFQLAVLGLHVSHPHLLEGGLRHCLTLLPRYSKDGE